MTPVILRGQNFDCVVSFPWEQGVIIGIRFQDKEGRLVEAFNVEAHRSAFDKWRHVVPIAKLFFEGILRGRR